MKLTPTKVIILIAIIVAVTVAATLTIVHFVNESAKENESESKGPNAAEVKEDFDYLSADLSQFISLPESEYQNNTITLGTQYLVTDEIVQQYIDDERFSKRQKANGGELYTDRPIAYGDSAFIYYTGYLNGEKFEGGSNADDKYSYELVIGSGSFIPGFEDALIGVIPANTSKTNPYSFEVTFPEDYSHVDLAGKKAVFEVWVEYIIQYTIPEFNNDYVSKILLYNGTAEQYRAEVKKNLEDASKGEAEDAAISAIMNKLIEKATIHEFPAQSVNYWYARYLDQFEYYRQYYAYYYGYSFSSVEDFIKAYLGLEDGASVQDEVAGLAKSMVRNNLIYYTIADQQNLSVSDEEYKEGVKALAEYYSDETTTYTEDAIVKEIGEAQIRQNILFDKIEDYLLEHCTIEYKDVEEK